MSKEPRRNVYVGHRYVPLIMGEWDKTISYEGLSIVTYQGNSYTSKKHTPVGIDIYNEDYWAVTGNYNIQVENYRKEVRDVKEEVDKKADTDYVSDGFKTVNNTLNLVKTDLDKTPKLVNVKSFGAVGDGITDDTMAIQEAFNSIETGTVYFPKGVYKLSRNNADRHSILISNKNNLTITGDKAKIITTDVDVKTDYICFHFKSCENINLYSLDFDIKLTGKESNIRTNHRILWFQSTDYEKSIVNGVNVEKNIFRINHENGSTRMIALYGILFNGYNGYIGHNYKVVNNEFHNITGRNIQFDQVYDCQITNNLITGFGRGFVSLPIRIINGTYNVVISGNTIRTVDTAPVSSMEMIQIQHGDLVIQPHDITIINNYLDCRANDNEAYGIRIRGGKDITISNNFILQTKTTNTAQTVGIMINESSVENDNITIISNHMSGWTQRLISNSDEKLENLFITLNYLIGSVKGREIYTRNQNIIRDNNWISLVNGFASGSNNTRTFHSDKKPETNDVKYNQGDVTINTNPVIGSYEKWFYIKNEFGNLAWKGAGLIEE